MPVPPIDLTRPECKATYNRMKELERSRRQWADRLQYTTDYEERQNILHTIEGLDNSIQMHREELLNDGCYDRPVVVTKVLEIPHLEHTQSTQYYSADGTGAGGDNTIWSVESKPTLVRAYFRTWLSDSNTASGVLTVMGYNPNTLKYDTLRRTVAPMNVATIWPSIVSRRSVISETLNFLVPADVCWGKVLFDVQAWISGHESDPSGTNPSYQARASFSAEFNRRRTPIVHCFRMALSQTIPGTPAPLQFAAPSFADCQATMAHAERMFPLSRLDIRDRGTRAFTGPLQNDNDYDAVRRNIQTAYEATSPTPARNEIYVAMLPGHQAGASVFGHQLFASLQSTVGFNELFTHELGHWLLPGDDHVAGCVNPALPMIQIDANYPDYPNATQRAGIGEWGVDLEAAGPRLHDPERGDIMSYCPNPLWISPYNYLRAFNGPVLSWAEGATPAPRADAQKLLLAFRLHRDETVEFQWALHLPGEPPRWSAKGTSDLVVELHDAGGALIASSPCHRPADRRASSPYEDFQEVLPWFENVANVVLVRDRHELARWPVEDAATERVRALTVTATRDSDGSSAIRFTWAAPEDAKRRHYMLRFTPDDGHTWIPVANDVKEGRVDVPSHLLRGIERARFQLAVSTGFRTTLVESQEAVAGPPLEREVTIIQPEAGARIAQGDPVSLVGVIAARLDGSEDTVSAYWNSNRDGFLADGLRAMVGELSVGRHSLRLVVEDETGGEIAKTVVVWVIPRGTPESDAESRR